jgi:hypothetical protein
LDAIAAPDSLKYDTTPLHLTGSFAIEMSVRGAALNRIGEYYLFETDQNFYLKKLGSYLVLGRYISTWNNIQIVTIPPLENNKFYRVIVKVN